MRYRNAVLACSFLVSVSPLVFGQRVPEPAAQLIATLESGATLEKKFAACRSLAESGAEQAVPALAELLRDPELAHMARYALEPMPAGKADAALRDALSHVKGELLIGVIDSIGVRRDAAAVGALTPLLRHADAGVAAAAADALGLIATPAAADALTAQLGTGPSARQVLLVDAGLRCAQGLSKHRNADHAVRVYDRLRGMQLPTRQAVAAARGTIVARGADDGLPLLIALLEGPDGALSALALGLARELRGTQVTSRLAGKLPDLQPRRRAKLIGALADRGDAAAVPALLSATRDASAAVRAAALAALGRIGDASAIAPLVAAIGNAGRPDEADVALAALGVLRAPGVSAAIVDTIPNAQPELRAKLIGLLAERRATDSVPRLLELAEGEDAAVRSAALSALAALARPDDLPALVEVLLAVSGEKEAKAALRAVNAAAIQEPNISRRADALVEQLSQTTDTAKRILLIRALAGVGSFRAFDALRATLRAPESELRDAALRGLVGWADATPARLLLELASTADNAVHRALALRAVLRLAGMVAADCQTPSPQVLDWFRAVDGMVRGVAETKLLLSGLTGLKHPVALDMALPRLDEAGVESEAALAVIALAPAAAAVGARGAAHAALEKVIATVADARLKARAAAALKGLTTRSEYILDWQVCGPYTQGKKQCQQLYPIAFPPEKKGARVAWRMLPRSGGPTGQITDVGRTVSGSHRVAYVRTWLVSERQQAAKLEFGFDDGGKAWLNGEVVIEANTAGACVPGHHKADIALNEGRNLLFVKLTQHSGPWQFCARLLGADGKPLRNVTIATGRAPAATPPPAHAGGRPEQEADLSGIPAVALFNGDTLEGWEGAPGCFHARNGAIVGGQLEKPIGISDYLCTTREFGDFELTAEVRTLGRRTNGGIQFWGARVPNSHAMTGFQADVCDGAYWGCLYLCGKGFAARVPQQELNSVLRLGDWNEYRIRAVNKRIRIWLNGYRTVDYTVTDPKIPTKGLFGLQTHKGPPGEGWYRNIRIREVK